MSFYLIDFGNPCESYYPLLNLYHSQRRCEDKEFEYREGFSRFKKSAIVDCAQTQYQEDTYFKHSVYIY